LNAERSLRTSGACLTKASDLQPVSGLLDATSVCLETTPGERAGTWTLWQGKGGAELAFSPGGYYSSGGLVFEGECVRHLYGPWFAVAPANGPLGGCPLGYQYVGSP
jgi:hypothetical protein